MSVLSFSVDESVTSFLARVSAHTQAGGEVLWKATPRAHARGSVVPVVCSHHREAPRSPGCASASSQRHRRSVPNCREGGGP